jgi:hypothetical protein
MPEFLLPWTMIAGGVLVTSPIVIHLINRMRFKRIRWAAMEFLLKSQKRNQRKLIIEQLILLLLRILLVLLTGFLLARFVGFAFGNNAPQNTRNVVLLDDTLSMNDRWIDEKGEARSTLAAARRSVVEDVAKNALKAGGAAQFLRVVRITKPDEDVFDDKLNDQSVRDLAEKTLPAKITGTALHVDLTKALEKARKILDEHSLDKRILYIVSDFRHADWSSPNLKPIAKELNALIALNVEVKLIDVADPIRQSDEKDAPRHANVAITRFQPNARQVSKNIAAEFTGYLVNHGDSDRHNLQVRFRVDGQDRPDLSVPIAKLEHGKEQPFTLPMFFDKPDLHTVTAFLDFDVKQEGLEEDNSRHALVEVVDRVSVLAVDGDLPKSRQENGDSYFLQVMFDKNGVSAGHDLKVIGPADLDAVNLSKFATVYVVNVGALSDKAVANLEAYVRGGGSVAFFLGERVVDAKFYNEKLYRGGAGVFPVPLDRPSPELTEAERNARHEQSLNDPQIQMFLREDEHPILAALANKDLQFLFYFIDIDRHFTVPRALWRPVKGRSVELITLPNRKSVNDYKDGIQGFLDRLPKDDPKYSARLNHHRAAIQKTIADQQQLHRLAGALDELLRDKGDPKAADRPNLVEFWAAPERQALKLDAERWVETTRYGDPLVVEAKVGRGRSVACLTTLGKHWNNWAGGADGSDTYPIFMRDLQRFLTSVPADAQLLAGTKLTLSVDPAIYKSKARVFVVEDKGGKRVPLPDDLTGTTEGQLNFTFDQTDQPGSYLVELTAKADDAKELLGFTFNVDTGTESDLRRTSPSDLRQEIKGITFSHAGSVDLQPPDPKTDVSQGPWLYLLFLLLLIAEQAMAVHLSFHAHGAQAPVGATPRPAVA